jgi:hypothetical protein
LIVSIFALLISLGMVNHLQAETITTSFSAMNTRQEMNTYYRLAPGYTVIDEEHRTLFIDYDNGLIHNLSKQASSCSSFSLLASDIQDEFVAVQADIFAEVKFLEERAEPFGKGNSLQVCTIVYAPRALLHKRVVEAHFDQFGLRFVPGAKEFVVDKGRADFAAFAGMARQNTLGKKLNPLIYRLDLTHLLSRFGGLPVHSDGPEMRTKYHFSIEDENTLRLLQQKHCSSQ